MWIVYAFAASILWGLTYVINEQIYKKISVITSLGITSLLTAVVMFAVAYMSGFLNQDITEIAGSKSLLRLLAAETIVLIIAELFIGFSIAAKNATLAGLIEISYPIFITIFAYVIFKERQIAGATVAGGMLIFFGVFIIYYFNVRH